MPSRLLLTMPLRCTRSISSVGYIGSSSLLKQVCAFGKGLLLLNGTDSTKKRA